MLSIFANEIKYYFKNKIELIEFICFIALLSMLLPFAWVGALKQGPELAVAMLWLAMLAGISLISAGLFTRDLESGVLELYQLAPLGLERVVLAKWLALYVITLIPLLLAIPVAGTWFHIPAAGWPQLALGIAAGAAAVVTINSLMAALLAGQGRGAALLALLAIPLAIPILIFGAAYCQQPDLWNGHLLFLIGFTCFMLPLACFAAASSLRVAH